MSLVDAGLVVHGVLFKCGLWEDVEPKRLKKGNNEGFHFKRFVYTLVSPI